MNKRILISAGIFVFIAASFFILKNNARNFQINPINKTQQEKTETKQDIPLTTVIAKNLDVPWAIAFLPDGNTLVTERSGNVKLVNMATGEQTTITTLDDVTEVSESGLLGIA